MKENSWDERKLDSTWKYSCFENKTKKKHYDSTNIGLKERVKKIKFPFAKWFLVTKFCLLYNIIYYYGVASILLNTSKISKPTQLYNFKEKIVTGSGVDPGTLTGSFTWKLDMHNTIVVSFFKTRWRILLVCVLGMIAGVRGQWNEIGKWKYRTTRPGIYRVLIWNVTWICQSFCRMAHL